MASVTVSASAARVLAPASKARISAKSLGASASSARGVAVAARLPARSARKSRALTITAAGLPPNLAGMMGNMDPEKLKEIQAAYEQAMKDPETAKKVNAQMAQMQGLMNNPMVAKQMQAMNNMIAVREAGSPHEYAPRPVRRDARRPDRSRRRAERLDRPSSLFLGRSSPTSSESRKLTELLFPLLASLRPRPPPSWSLEQNPDMQRRIAGLKDDPEFQEFFQDVQKNGPSAMMKYSNDAAFLKKLNDKLGGEEAIRAAVGGDIPVDVPGGAAAAPAAPAPAPEVETLHDAARYGDLEAVEDFLAIGKDVDARDSSQRTPLHYAIAFGKGETGEEIFDALVKADSDLTAVDEKKNTPLHYACGYGKIFAVRALLEKGADISAENGTGKTPLDLVKLEAKNPINEETELLAKLGA